MISTVTNVICTAAARQRQLLVSDMVRKMSTKIYHLIRLSVTSAALTGFIVAGGPVFPSTFGLSTPAYAVNGIRAIDDLCVWEGLGWDDLEPSEQKAWTKLGWTGEMWESEAKQRYRRPSTRTGVNSTKSSKALSLISATRRKAGNSSTPVLARNDTLHRRHLIAELRRGVAI